MAANGRKKSSEKKQEEQKVGNTGVVPAQSAAPLGSAHNPIQGPPLEDFSRGPEYNYSVPRHREDAGEAQLGSQANPIVGPPTGSSPGVQNPGELTIQGPAEPALEAAADLGGGDNSMHNMRMRAASTTPNPALTAPARIITVDKDGKPSSQTVIPQEGQTTEEAVRAALANPGGKKNSAMDKLQQENDELLQSHSEKEGKLAEEHQKQRTELGEKQAKEMESFNEKGTKLGESHRKQVEKEGQSEELIQKQQNERLELGNELTELQQRQQEEAADLERQQQEELAELRQENEGEVKELRERMSQEADKQRQRNQDGPTHRRATKSSGNGNKQQSSKKNEKDDEK